MIDRMLESPDTSPELKEGLQALLALLKDSSNAITNEARVLMMIYLHVGRGIFIDDADGEQCQIDEGMVDQIEEQMPAMCNFLRPTDERIYIINNLVKTNKGLA